MTPEEQRHILAAAEADEKAPSEWARETLLKAAQGGSSDPIGMDIFTECVGSQLLMMNAFELLLKAAGMQTQKIRQIFDQVQKTKLIQAQGLLAKRARSRAQESNRTVDNIPG